jgi:hypothetical protein
MLYKKESAPVVQFMSVCCWFKFLTRLCRSFSKIAKIDDWRRLVFPSVCLSVRSSARNNSAPNETIFMKYYIWVLLENLSRKFKTYKTLTLHEDQYTFLILSHSFLLRMRNISTKIVKKIIIIIIIIIIILNDFDLFQTRLVVHSKVFQVVFVHFFHNLALFLASYRYPFLLHVLPNLFFILLDFCQLILLSALPKVLHSFCKCQKVCILLFFRKFSSRLMSVAFIRSSEGPEVVSL